MRQLFEIIDYTIEYTGIGILVVLGLLFMAYNTKLYYKEKHSVEGQFYTTTEKLRKIGNELKDYTNCDYKLISQIDNYKELLRKLNNNEIAFDTKTLKEITWLFSFYESDVFVHWSESDEIRSRINKTYTTINEFLQNQLDQQEEQQKIFEKALEVKESNEKDKRKRKLNNWAKS